LRTLGFDEKNEFALDRKRSVDCEAMVKVPDEVPERISFPKEEELLLEHWRAIDAFETSNRLSEGRPVYSFYDGPPFATGLPHYGHLLAGTIKDTVTRYAYQTGHHVPRRFGWDCHGLPIEFEIEKKLGIKTREDVLALGIDKYNAECRSIVMRFSAEWEKTVRRIGRWIDFKNDYKTLDTSFMESVWWVFKTLHDKGLVYRGFKVMPYSMGCTTPLSNFEANLNYKDTNDPAVTVRFPIVVTSENDPNWGASFLAWTTTPWTLPSNLGLCVHPELCYVFVLDKQANRIYVLAESRLVQLYKNPGKSPLYQVLRKVVGADLVGLKYEPLFKYYADEYGARAFKVMSDTYVTDSDGTGIVHQAPAFGEDDYRVCLANGIIDKGECVPCPVDDSGRFAMPVADFVGMGVKEADKPIIAKLKHMDRLVKSENLNHSYPFCWRSDTPLIYKAVPSWFVRVESIKEQLIANNALTRWVPESVQLNRFGNWLQNARDWNVSRNRYWGTPLPIWRNEISGEIIVVGSIQELSDLSGIAVTDISDLHRESVDNIVLISPKTGDKLCRVSEVFDCWFESGSMPYASVHYPFGGDSKEVFAGSFPADFIAEGLDQTRGWFYTLMVLSTALFDKPAFKNCVVNGLVLASDGKKMSKRLQNYPDPVLVLDSHGADALRLYLINSPVVRGEPLRFREEGVRDVIRDVLLPWFNAYRFLIQNVRLLATSSGNSLALADKALYAKHKNQMDLWIESSLGSLITFVREEMNANRLYTVVPKLLSFIDSLTNWYVRLNRPRLKGTSCSEDGQRAALSTLAHVLLSLSRLMAPFTPFFADYTYQSLKNMAPSALVADSVHYLMLPELDTSVVDQSFEEAVGFMQEVILLGRVGREHRDLAIKMPLKEALVVHRDEAVLKAVQKLESYVMLELNVRTIKYTTDESKFVLLKANADGRTLGRKLGKAFKAVHAAVRAMTPEQVCLLEENGYIELEGHNVSSTDVKVSRELRKEFQGGQDVQVEAASNGLLLALNMEQDDDLISEGLAREIINRIQRLRKKSHLDPKDRIEVFVETQHQKLLEVLDVHAELFSSSLNVPRPLSSTFMNGAEVVIAREEVDPVSNMKITIYLTRAGLVPSLERLTAALSENKEAAETVALYLRSRSPAALGLAVGNGLQSVDVSIAFADTHVSLRVDVGDHVFYSTADRVHAGVGA
jgi:isoleucyl-tRNA synthetase